MRNVLILVPILLLVKVSSVSSASNSFTQKFQDTFQEIGKIIETFPRTFPFVNAFRDNPTIALEQLLVEPYRRDLDTAATAAQLIEIHGYGFETHYVITDDGYILQLYRVFNPNITSDNYDPILLIHGLFVSCTCWLFNGKQSVAFFLADEGKDVWLMNVRGTTYSTNHTTYNPHIDREFWDYTFIDFGIHDLPATVDYIKNITGYEKITVAGHSQGSLTLIVYLSLHPEGSSNFDLVFLLAPIGFLGHLEGTAALFPRTHVTNAILGKVLAPFVPGLAAVDASLTAICTFSITQPMCQEILSSILGYDDPQVQVENDVNVVSQIDRPSFKDGVHLLQSLGFDHVRFYDYGETENLRRYGTKIPPALPYHRIPTYNLVVISGKGDYLSTRRNVQKFVNSLSSRPLVEHKVTAPNFNHFDFVFAKNATLYFNEPFYRIYLDYSNNSKIINKRNPNARRDHETGSITDLLNTEKLLNVI